MTLKRKNKSDVEDVKTVSAKKAKASWQEKTTSPKPIKGILKKRSEVGVTEKIKEEKIVGKKINFTEKNDSKSMVGEKRKLESNGQNKKKLDFHVKRSKSEVKTQYLANGANKLAHTKKAKKERKNQRKSAEKNNFEVITEAKKLWDIVRVKAKKTNREENIQKLHALLKGNINRFVCARDTSRIVECLYTMGSESIKSSLLSELKDNIISMSKGKYSKYVVIRMLRDGSKENRSSIISCFSGSVMSLMKHTEASLVIETIYNEYANVDQRKSLIEEFYGEAFSSFKTQNNDTESVDVAKKKEVALDFMQKYLIDIIEKPVLGYSLIHKIFDIYLENCSSTSRSEMIDSIVDKVIQMIHTHDGRNVGLTCAWHGSAKNRKSIAKNFKGNISKICKDKHGHYVLLAMLDTIDDTKLLQTTIIKEILADLKEIFLDVNGRKVILFLLSPRNTVYFHPDVISILQKGDTNTVSKKDKDVRRKELLSFVSQPLLEFVINNIKDLMVNPSARIVCQAVIKHCEGDKERTFEVISKTINCPLCETDNSHMIEQTNGHLLLRHLLHEDKQNVENEKLVPTFAETLMKVVSAENIKTWINCNRGNLVLISLLEVGLKDVTSQVKTILQPIKKDLAKKNFQDAKLLLEKLNETK